MAPPFNAASDAADAAALTAAVFITDATAAEFSAAARVTAKRSLATVQLLGVVVLHGTSTVAIDRSSDEVLNPVVRAVFIAAARCLEVMRPE
jgi:hypothetical protein